jgi:Tfp pilus assembly protein PilO
MVIKKTYQKSIIMAVVAALVSLLAVTVALWGMSGQKSMVLTQKAQLQKLTSDLANLDTILSDEKAYAGEVARVSATLPKEYSDVATAVSAIELTAKTNNLTTDLAIDEKSKPETGDLKSLTIAIKTSGSYSDISKFVSGIATLPYHTRVDALAFDAAGGKVTATVTIRLFMQ